MDVNRYVAEVMEEFSRNRKQKNPSSSYYVIEPPEIVEEEVVQKPTYEEVFRKPYSNSETLKAIEKVKREIDNEERLEFLKLYDETEKKIEKAHPQKSFYVKPVETSYPFRGEVFDFDTDGNHERAGIILFNKNEEILCVKGIKWGFPKGRVERTEFPYFGALREFREETGNELHDEDIYLGYEFIDRTHYFIFYTAKTLYFDYSKIDKEISAVRWTSPIKIWQNPRFFNIGTNIFCRYDNLEKYKRVLRIARTV